MDNKKIICSLTGIIIIAIIVNLLIWINSGKNSGDSFNNTNNSFSEIPDEAWNDAGIDPKDINIIKMEMTKMIDEVYVEKNPVCSGEDFLVRVKAQNLEGNKDSLTYRISNKKGNPVIMNYKATGDKKIHVFVRDNIKTLDHKVITVKVIECPDRAMALLQSTFNTSKLNEVDYEVIQMQGMEGNCTYIWDFGNGKTARSKIGSISHNYGNREQKSYTSTFMAKVTITDEKGQTIIARKDVTFPNVQWISSRMGLAVIPITYDRIATLKNEVYTSKIKMKNIFDMPLSFDNAQVAFVPCSSNIAQEKITFSIGDFIRKTYLEAGEYAEDTLRFNKDILPYPTCTVSMKFIGKLANDKDVTAPLYINIPLTKESIEEAIQKGRARVISNGIEIEKVLRARKILNRKIVTPDDISKLEREGKL